MDKRELLLQRDHHLDVEFLGPRAEEVVRLNDDDTAEVKLLAVHLFIHENDARREWVTAKVKVLEFTQKCLSPSWRS